jgi:hypothetical protein
MVSKFNFKSILITAAAVTDSKKNFLAKQYKLDPEVVAKIAEYDPTLKGTFVAWLVNVYSKEGENLNLIASLTEPLTRFVKLTNNPNFDSAKKDIGKYTSKQLLDLVGDERKFRRNLSDKEIERLIMKEGIPGAELIWDGGGFKMWKVTNSKYARFLSSNTSWCTAQPNYSKNYCISGTLYPIYYLGKPFAQGHIDGTDGSLEFLDVHDNAINLENEEVVKMLEVINVPIMDALRRRILGSAYLKRAIENSFDEQNLTPEVLKHYQDLVLKSGNLQSIAMVCRYGWWDEGWDILLDHPDLFVETVKNIKPGVLDNHPEITEEVLSYYTPENIDVRDCRQFVDMGRTDFLVDMLFKGALKDYSNIGPDYWPDYVREAVRAEILKRLGTMPELTEDVSNAIARLNEGEVQIAYWKKFVNKPKREWSRLTRFEEYNIVNDKFKKFPLTLSVGQTVTIGPDSKEATKIGKITEADGVSYKVTWEDGTKGTYTFSKNEDKYEIIPNGAIAKKRNIVAPQRDENGLLLVGTRVKAREGWSYGNQGDGGEGVITAHASRSRFDYEVEWDTGGVWLYSDDDIEPVEVEVKTQLDGRGLIEPVVGMRVVKGPTWRWNFTNDRKANDNTGTIVSVNAGISSTNMSRNQGWVIVQWDGQEDDEMDVDQEQAENLNCEPGNTYRFGIQGDAEHANANPGKYYADVVPTDVDQEALLKSIKDSGLWDESNGNH